MKEQQVISLRSVARRMAQLKKSHLTSLEDSRQKIFKICETENSASILINWSRFSVEEPCGFLKNVAATCPLYTPEDFFSLLHPEDGERFLKILDILISLSSKKEIKGDDKLSSSFRMMMAGNHVHIQGESGFAVSEKSQEVIMWFNLHKTGMVDSFRHFDFKWEGQELTHIEIESLLLQRKDRILTKRESQILCLLMKGESNTEMASTLNISTATVKKHISNMFEKLQIHSRADLVSVVEKDPTRKV
jgi:DNA-binding CsgD family transcriptional regulator